MTARTYRARIAVRLSPGVNDPQGNAVAERLRGMGHADVREVRIGRVIDLVVDADDADGARQRAERMCHELLANPVIESWQTEVVEVG